MFYSQIMEAKSYIQSKVNRKPEIGIVLGSGLGAIVEAMENIETIPYETIPHFPHSNIQGHADQFVFGKIGNKEVVCMQGRFHYYEGFTMKQLTFPIYVLSQLGVKDLIVTNACGGINQDFEPGDLMIISDYINFLGDNPLIGDNDERLGPRFPDMTEAYNHELMDFAKDCANQLNIPYKTGVYALFNGPCYETAAEIRAFKALGADAVGMSTVPETMVANYLGMRVLGISCITNMATGIAKVKHSHEKVLEVANNSSAKLCEWVQYMVENWK
ncbi:purine-nucleoside phosphorylase [Floccifex sp.]|uniref:purine-nucleoside phosphorylase n=1 Tax=Floccifex sp. TaxID=2815810 RepID=UPI002A762751|nr:purine-nucleoside phosphorylase [Floccifex sp.]MDD7281821.1 purine-nucleoside phosphorylase [Erysipelotrichaceae bacterium]MDY2958506.1 purine-nucleoside phosphorylase [Floccifex sp.]